MDKCNLMPYQFSFSLPCEQRLHFRGMSWRAKSSLCRQPFNFLSCMRKIRHAIRKQLVRQICVSFEGIKLAKTTCEQLSSSFCFVLSGFKYFSRSASITHKPIFHRRVFTKSVSFQKKGSFMTI